VDRFTSNQYQNDHRPIVQMSLNRFQEWNCFIGVIFVIVSCT